jgi:hypothetical protein
MGLTLTKEQADLMAEEIAAKLSGVMEGPSEDAGELLKACGEMEPFRVALEELREKQTVADLDLLRRIAAEALSAHRESAGDALASIRHVKAGRIVEHQSEKGESPEEIIAREQTRAEVDAEGAALAQTIVWAVRHAEAESKAAEGDRLARESVATQERWDEENRKLAEGTKS